MLDRCSRVGLLGKRIFLQQLVYHVEVNAILGRFANLGDFLRVNRLGQGLLIAETHADEGDNPCDFLVVQHAAESGHWRNAVRRIVGLSCDFNRPPESLEHELDETLVFAHHPFVGIEWRIDIRDSALAILAVASLAVTIAVVDFFAELVELQIALREIDLRHLHGLLSLVVELEIASQVLLGLVIPGQLGLAGRMQGLRVVLERFENSCVRAAHPFRDRLLEAFQSDLGAFVVVLP